MKIDLHYLFIIYLLLLTAQHFLLPRFASEARKKQSAFVASQIFLVLYCIWIGASKNPDYEMSGFIMLVVSLGLFSWRLKVLFRESH